jgi:hypothetical protein
LDIITNYPTTNSKHDLQYATVKSSKAVGDVRGFVISAQQPVQWYSAYRGVVMTFLLRIEAMQMR